MSEDQIAEELKRAYAAAGLDTEETADVSLLLNRANRDTGMRDLLVLGFSNIFLAFLMIFSRLYASGEHGRRQDGSS